jgi:hypothetical protein
MMMMMMMMMMMRMMTMTMMMMTHFVSPAVALISHLTGYFGTWLRRSLLSYKYFMGSEGRGCLVSDTKVSSNLVHLLPLNRQCGKHLRS